MGGLKTGSILDHLVQVLSCIAIVHKERPFETEEVEAEEEEVEKKKKKE